MNKEIDLHKIGDPLKDYIESIPLFEYSNLLTKYQLLRLDPYFAPFHITKGCLSREKINKLIDLLIKKNKTLKSLNLSRCVINVETIQKLGAFKDLKSLNLHNTINLSQNGFNINAAINQENSILINIMNLNLKLLDISNNIFLNKPIIISAMKSLEILSMENCVFRDSLEYIEYSKLHNLRELDISGNQVFIEEIEEISKLKNLELLYCDNINIRNLNQNINKFNILVNNIIKIKTLEYLDVSIMDMNIISEDDQIVYSGQDVIIDINHNWMIDDQFLLDKINLLINKLPKLKRLRCIFNSNFNSREILIKNVKVIINEEIYGLILSKQY